MDVPIYKCPSCPGHISKWCMDNKQYGVCVKCRQMVCDGCIRVDFRGGRPGSMCMKCNCDDILTLGGLLPQNR